MIAFNDILIIIDLISQSHQKIVNGVNFNLCSIILGTEVEAGRQAGKSAEKSEQQQNFELRSEKVTANPKVRTLKNVGV